MVWISPPLMLPIHLPFKPICLPIRLPICLPFKLIRLPFVPICKPFPSFFVEVVSLAAGSPAAPAATSSSPSSCPASCTCSCPSTPSTSLLYTPRPSFQPTVPTAPPAPSSYQVSYNEEQSSQGYQLAGQGYQQHQPSNSVVSNPTQEGGTLFYQRPEEEEEEPSETTAAPEVTPYVQSYPSYSKPFTSFSTSSPAPPPAPALAGYPSTSPPSFPPQVSLALSLYNHDHPGGGSVPPPVWGISGFPLGVTQVQQQRS